MSNPRFIPGPGAGFQAVLEMFRAMDAADRERLLGQVRARDPSLAAAIEDQVFRFEDIVTLEPAELQRLLRETPSAVVALSLRGMNEEFHTKVFAAMSTRAAESLREEMQALGPRRLPDVLEARRKVIEFGRGMGLAGISKK